MYAQPPHTKLLIQHFWYFTLFLFIKHLYRHKNFIVHTHKENNTCYRRSHTQYTHFYSTSPTSFRVAPINSRWRFHQWRGRASTMATTTARPPTQQMNQHFVFNNTAFNTLL